MVSENGWGAPRIHGELLKLPVMADSCHLDELDTLVECRI